MPPVSAELLSVFLRIAIDIGHLLSKQDETIQILFFLLYLIKRGEQAMTEEEISELYIRLAFQYESAIGRLLDKKIIDQDLVDRHRKSFYDSLDEEKPRTAQKIADYTEIILRYMRGMIC